MIAGTRKALEYGMLQSFELKRSKGVKRLIKKELAYRLEYSYSVSGSNRNQIKFRAISTVAGTR